MREKDANTAWDAASDATLEERRYYCQNWRADVVALLTAGGDVSEWIRYSAYGEATVYPFVNGDYDADGDVDGDDTIAFSAAWDSNANAADVDRANGVDGDDVIAFAAAWDAGYASTAWTAGGGLPANAGQLSVTSGNRIGYAGYQFDPATEQYLVRHRVYSPEMGRWTRRDPLGYVDGMGLCGYCGAAALRYLDPLGLFGAPSHLVDATAWDILGVRYAVDARMDLQGPEEDDPWIDLPYDGIPSEPFDSQVLPALAPAPTLFTQVCTEVRITGELVVTRCCTFLSGVLVVCTFATEAHAPEIGIYPIPRSDDPNHPCRKEIDRQRAACGSNRPRVEAPGKMNIPPGRPPRPNPNSRWCQMLFDNMMRANDCRNARIDVLKCHETHFGPDRSGYDHKEVIRRLLDQIIEMDRLWRELCEGFAEA